MSANASDHKYLIFQIEDRSWGLPVGRVREIIRPLKVLPLPDSPHYVEGVMNLRGRVVPLVNLRTRLNYPPAGETERTAVIIVRLAGEGRAGLLVDAVEQVLHIESDKVEKPPAMSAGGGCVAAIGHVGQEVVTLLDIDQVTGEVATAATAPAMEQWFEGDPAATAAN